MTESEPTTSQLLLRSFTGGPFISGTTHQILKIGEVVSAAKAIKASKTKAAVKRPKSAQDELAVKQPKSALKGSKEAQTGKGNAKAGSSAAVDTEKKKKQDKRQGGPQIKDLIEAGLFQAGKDNVTVNYKGVTYTATLNSDGSITYQGQQFVAASAFSVHVKRLQTPNKQGDDGWKSVHVDGIPLDEWRTKLLAEGAQPMEVEGDDEAAAAPEQEEPDATHWVQCSACEQWRVVPDECWPQVEADTRDDWYCKDAWWDLTEFEPFTEACKGAKGGRRG